MGSERLVRALRRRLDLLTDYDRRLRESWVRDWAKGLEAGANVLDAGAGDAHLAKAFRAQEYIAMDLRPRPSRYPIFLCADLHYIPLATESIDYVVSIQVLEHVKNPQQVLHEVARVLRAGGSACFSVPQADPEHEQPYDYFRFTSFSLAEMARSSGMEVRTIRKKGGYFRRLSAELRDLPFIVLPDDRSYRAPRLVSALRALLVMIFTFAVATALLALDRFDKRQTYTTGYFCVFEKPRSGGG